MKRFILMFVAIMFLANTFAVSAWAKPCMNLDMKPSVQQSMNMSNTPCHEDKEPQSPNKHCDGICLCVHVSINQTPTLNDNSYLNIPIVKSQKLLNQNERVASMATSPPQRPPKTNS